MYFHESLNSQNVNFFGSRIQIFHLCNDCSFQYRIYIFVANSVCRAVFKENYDEADQENLNFGSNKHFKAVLKCMLYFWSLQSKIVISTELLAVQRLY